MCGFFITKISYFANNGQLFLTQHTSITQGKGITWNNGDNYITGLSGYHIQFTTYDRGNCYMFNSNTSSIKTSMQSGPFYGLQLELFAGFDGNLKLNS